MTAKWKRLGVSAPSGYHAPLCRPTTLQTGAETMDEVAWDMMDIWPTAREWLSWVRRRGYGKTIWSGRNGSYPVRPIIAAQAFPWSTRKARKLP